MARDELAVMAAQFNPRTDVYHTALHIGAKLGLKPDKIYLHRGTRAGARKLGVNTRSATLSVDSLPTPLRVLDPREAEDFLCIYKARFSA